MKILNSEIVYSGFLKIKKLFLENKGKQFVKEVMIRPNAVAAVVFNTVTKKYIFVSQWRAGSTSELLELVAGSIDSGETAENAIVREIGEELGYEVDLCERLCEFYVSPGGTSEKITTLYCEVSTKISEGGGIDNEDITIVEYPELDVVGLLNNDNIEDAKTLIGLMYHFYAQAV